MGKTWDDATYDMTMWNAKNNAAFDFDFENVCTRAPGAISDDCCGTYPSRYLMTVQSNFVAMMLAELMMTLFMSAAPMDKSSW